MGVRYRAEFTSDRGIDWKIDLHDADYSSTVTTFNVFDITFTFPTESSEIETPIIGSEMSVLAYNENAAFDTLLSDIATAQEERFAICIYKDTVLDWVGFVLTDLIELADASKPYDVVLSATDSLARLKDVDYPYGLDATPTFIEAINRILDLTNLPQFWGANDDYLFTSVDWWDTNHPARAYTVDPANETLFDEDAIIIRNEGEPNTYQSAYEVLKQLCYTFDCRFFLSEGMWRFVQINQYKESTIFSHIYKKAGTLKTDANNTNLLKTIDKVSYWKESGGVDSWLVPLQAVQVNYNLYKVSQLIPLQQDYSSAISIGTLPSGVGLLFKCLINEQYVWNGAALDIFRTKYDVQIKLTATGTTYYLKGSNLYAERDWTTSSSDVYEIYTPYRAGKDWELDFPVQIQTNDIPANCTATFRLRKVEHQDYAGSSLAISGTYSYFIRLANLSCINSSDSDNNNPVVKTLWQVTNTDGVNPVDSTYILKLPDKIFGDGGVSQTGGLIANNAGTEVASSQWVHAGDSDNLNITNLLLQEVIARRKTPTKMMKSASFIGDIPLLYKISYDSSEWLFLGGSFSALNDQWSGTWFEIVRSVTNLDVEDRIGTDQPNWLPSSALSDHITRVHNGFRFDETTEINYYAGAFAGDFLLKTSDYTLLESDAVYTILVDTTSGAVAISLPDGARDGIVFQIIVIDATAITTIDTDGSATINGAASVELSNLYDKLKVKYYETNTDWLIL